MAKRDALKELSRRFPLAHELEDFIKGLINKNDRDLAIMGGSLLEGCFERALTKSLQDQDPSLLGRLFKNRGPLADLESKILVSQAFGLINNNFAEEMHRVRIIRNVFAHSILGVDFETQKIREELNSSLLASAFFSMITTKTYEDEELERLLKIKYKDASGKDRYEFLIRCGCSVLGF